nr:MAG TPA: hypothetical protein [Caudoviricetes sp.]
MGVVARAPVRACAFFNIACARLMRGDTKLCKRLL